MSDNTSGLDNAERFVDPEDARTDPRDLDMEPSGATLAEHNLADPKDLVVVPDANEDKELDPDTTEDDPVKTLAAEAVVEAAGSSRPVKRRTAQAPVKKAAPTPKRKRTSQPYENESRVGPVTFVNQSVGELKKVNWPTSMQLKQYFVAVLMFVLFVITFVGVLDLLFGWALLKLLG